MDVRVSLISSAPARIRVEGWRDEGAVRWSFRNAYAGVLGLGERIDNFALAGADGAGVTVRQLAPGEFEAARAASAFRYDVRLDPPRVATDAAHVSWLAGEHGVLMLGDLLPLLPREQVTLRLDLPAPWSVASIETRRGDGRYEMTDAEQSIFFLGRNVRDLRRRGRGVESIVAVAGEWAFSDDDVSTMVGGILKEHGETFGGGSRRGPALTVLAPFPVSVPGQTWAAETRGNTVFLLSGRLPTKAAGLAHLSVPLAHELFHLWVPNALALDGNYDWFYEGFTLYQAMRTGMSLGHLTFEDYLNALGRAFDNYRAARGTEALSLIEASRRRWTSGASLVYNQGMLVAFLYDLNLRQQSGGKQTLAGVYRELFRRHGSPHAGRTDGNGAVTGILSGMKGMSGFTARYIESPAEIDLAEALVPFGLRAEAGPVRTRVTVAGPLSGSQRDLLRKLGYNKVAFLTSQGVSAEGYPAR